MKCWEGFGWMVSMYGGRFRIKDLGDGVSQVVGTERKEGKKVGQERIEWDGMSVEYC